MTGVVRSPRMAVAVCTIAVAVVAAPVRRLRRPGARDSFPLSHYPMFSADRGTHLTVHHLQGVRSDGSVQYLDSRLAATGGMNQERKQIASAVRRGRGDRVARRVARRLDRRGAVPAVVRVEVVRGSFPLGAALGGRVTADHTIVVATAAVPGREVVPGAWP